MNECQERLHAQPFSLMKPVQVRNEHTRQNGDIGRAVALNTFVTVNPSHMCHDVCSANSLRSCGHQLYTRCNMLQTDNPQGNQKVLKKSFTIVYSNSNVCYEGYRLPM